MMMRRPRSARGVIAGATATVLATAGLVAGIPATATAATDATAAAAAAPAGTTITPNPWYAGDPFQGWGTSLVWFANATGGYPEELREDLYQAVFGEEGLDLNIARYNVGGGNASDVEDYLRAGGAVEGWWQADADGSAGTYDGVPTTYAERDALRAAWDPADPSHYDADADATQRWWVERLAQDDQISHWETFANSAPYFMTESGYVSGGFGSTARQLRPESEADFAAYLTRVTERLEQEHGIEVESIDPFNEPNTNYWGTTLRDGVPVGGRQEGMHVGPEQQVSVVRELAAQLAAPGTTTDAFIAAMDETNPGIFQQNWAAYPQDARDEVGRLNVHTYGTSGRLGVRDLAKQADSPLWMSEIEGSWVTGWDPEDIENGLGMAGRVIDDLRELEPDAWVLWQPVEDLYNMEPQGEDLNWGSMFIDLDCRPYTVDGVEVWKSERRVADAGGDPTSVEACHVEVNSKFAALRNFTKFIAEGDRLVAVDDADSTAAVRADGAGATVVHRNTSASASTVTLDLSRFGTIADGAAVTPFTTTQAPAGTDPTTTGVVEGAPVAVDVARGTATLTVPAKSVTTFTVDGVSGVAADAESVRDGDVVQLVGVQSGKALTAPTGAGGAVLASPATTPEVGARQAFTVRSVPTASGDERRVTLQAGDGRFLAATTSGTAFRAVDTATAAADPTSRWFATSTDGRTFSFVGEGVAQSLDVGGQSTAEGATVDTYGTNGGANQRWQVRDLEPVADQTVAVRTDAGVPPALPASVAPTYAWGTSAPVPVTWTTPDASAWQSPGRVDVPGTATDVFGSALAVTARVDVGGLTLTDPVSLTVAAGTPATRVADAVPGVVPARVGASEQTFDVPVTWDLSAVGDEDLAAVGVVSVPGTATTDDGSTLAASLALVVTDATLRNFAPDAGVTASATSTESGYPVDRTRNGVAGDKGWSNWTSGTKRAQDTLTYEFDEPREVQQAVVRFYADGSATSWAQALRVEQRAADGTWQPLPGQEAPQTVPAPPAGTAPVVTATFPTVVTTGVRVVLDAFPATHMVVSEVELYEPVAAPSAVSTLAALRVDGVPVEGFDPAVTEYAVTTPGSAWPTVTAIATDRSAEVGVTPVDPATGTATVTVTSPDRSSTTTTTVVVERQAVVRSVTVVGEVREGAEVRVVADVDPGTAVLDVEWLLDGGPAAPAEAGDGADGTVEPTVVGVAAIVDGGALVVPDGAAGRVLSVRVTATADGFAASEPVGSGGVVVAAAVVDPPDDGDPGDGGPGAGGPGTGQPGAGQPGAGGAGGGTGPGVGGGASGSTAAGRPGALARTGGDQLALGLLLGLGLLGVGATAVVTRRRRAQGPTE